MLSVDNSGIFSLNSIIQQGFVLGPMLSAYDPGTFSSTSITKYFRQASVHWPTLSAYDSVTFSSTSSRLYTSANGFYRWCSNRFIRPHHSTRFCSWADAFDQWFRIIFIKPHYSTMFCTWTDVKVIWFRYDYGPFPSISITQQGSVLRPLHLLETATFTLAVTFTWAILYIIIIFRSRGGNGRYLQLEGL